MRRALVAGPCCHYQPFDHDQPLHSLGVAHLLSQHQCRAFPCPPAPSPLASTSAQCAPHQCPVRGSWRQGAQAWRQCAVRGPPGGLEASAECVENNGLKSLQFVLVSRLIQINVILETKVEIFNTIRPFRPIGYSSVVSCLHCFAR